MRTNTKVVKTAVQQYIIDSLSAEGFNIPDTLPAKLENVCAEFKSAAGYRNNILRNKTYQNCFIDWLQGLPSSINITVYNHEIMELMESFGLPKPENKTEEQGIDLFYYLIFSNFVDLCKKHKVDFYSYTNNWN
jgi:hypothetical protein